MASPPSADDQLWAMARSRSFGSAGPHRRTGSGTLSSDGSFESDVSRYSWQGADVLGQCVRSPRESRRSLGLPASCKVPKQPRLRHALTMTDALIRGVREAIALEREEAQSLRDTLESASLHSAQSQGRLYETERRLRFTERYVKRLECHLADIEELAEQYGKQQRLRDATERLAAAFSTSGGAQSQRGLSQARSGFKECTEEMCLMEAQLENKMGTLLFELKGIQGFARLCAGDVYEIVVRLGSQEWRARGTVGRDHVQRWSRPRRILRPTLSDQLVIKASEVKTLGKHVLGTKVCDIGDLLSAHTQQMVIYLNSTGSLKLTLIVTWSAIESFPEDTLSRQVSTSSPSLRRRPTINSPRLGVESRAAAATTYPGDGDSQLLSPGVTSPDESGDSSESQSGPGSTPDILRRPGGLTAGRQSQRDSCSSAESVEAEPGGDGPAGDAVTGAAYTLEKRPEMRRDWFATVERKNKARKQQQAADQEAADRQEPPPPTDGAQEAGPAGGQLWRSSGRLRGACAAVAARLAGGGQRAAPLSALGAAVSRLAAARPGPARLRRWSQDSDVSVESALDKFSFLQSEHDEAESKPDLLEPGMTARTSDSGISSIVHQLSEEADRPAGDGTADSSLGLSESGSLAELPAEAAARSALDACLEMHLVYCLHLLEGATSEGPLRHRADSCLAKLARQAALLELMLQFPPPEEVVADTQIQAVWRTLCDGSSLYHVASDAACERLTALLRPRLEYRDAFLASKVSRLVLGRCLDVADFTADHQLTVFAFRDFTATTTFDRILEELAEEVQLTDTLLSHNAESIGRRLSQLVYMLPPPRCLGVVCQLLASAGQRVADTVHDWLREVGRTDYMRQQLVPEFMQLLESPLASEREGAVRALQQLSAPPPLAALHQLAAADADGRVRAAAQHQLAELGAEGRAALQQAMRCRAGAETAEEP